MLGRKGVCVFDKMLRKINVIVSILQISVRCTIFLSNKRYCGINKEKRNIPIVVSLTSFPERIEVVVETIKSLLIQTMKPDRIILWLAKEQFPYQEQDLPSKLVSLKKYGLEILWCDDIRSYKKLIPTLCLEPNAIIVTADDDIYYRVEWLKGLYEAYLQNPQCIICYRATKFYLTNEGMYKTIGGGHDLWPEPSYLHKLTGCGGVLYPVGIFYQDICREDIFLDICKTNDDIWFWLMAVLNKTKVYCPNSDDVDIIEVKKAKNTPSLTSINDNGEHLFWKDFYNMLKHYPEIDNMLRNEYDRFTRKVNL